MTIYSDLAAKIAPKIPKSGTIKTQYDAAKKIVDAQKTSELAKAILLLNKLSEILSGTESAALRTELTTEIKALLGDQEGLSIADDLFSEMQAVDAGGYLAPKFIEAALAKKALENEPSQPDIDDAFAVFHNILNQKDHTPFWLQEHNEGTNPKRVQTWLTQLFQTKTPSSLAMAMRKLGLAYFENEFKAELTEEDTGPNEAPAQPASDERKALLSHYLELQQNYFMQEALTKLFDELKKKEKPEYADTDLATTDEKSEANTRVINQLAYSIAQELEKRIHKANFKEFKTPKALENFIHHELNSIQEGSIFKALEEAFTPSGEDIGLETIDYKERYKPAAKKLQARINDILSSYFLQEHALDVHLSLLAWQYLNIENAPLAAGSDAGDEPAQEEPATEDGAEGAAAPAVVAAPEEEAPVVDIQAAREAADLVTKQTLEWLMPLTAAMRKTIDSTEELDEAAETQTQLAFCRDLLKEHKSSELNKSLAAIDELEGDPKALRELLSNLLRDDPTTLEAVLHILNAHEEAQAPKSWRETLTPGRGFTGFMLGLTATSLMAATLLLTTDEGQLILNGWLGGEENLSSHDETPAPTPVSTTQTSTGFWAWLCAPSNSSAPMPTLNTHTGGH